MATHKIRATIHGIRALQLDITSPNATESLGREFDAISAIDMLYHIMSDSGYAAAFSNMARSLKPGGHLIFTENLLHHGPTRAIVQANRTFDMVMNLLSSNGLTPVRRAPVFVLMNYPADTRSAIPKRLWTLLTLPASYFDPLGHLYGAVLLPIDLLLTQLIKEGPSTEIVICRKT